MHQFKVAMSIRDLLSVIVYKGETNRISAGLEVVLSLGAIHRPKVLIQSGIGDRTELQRLGIPLVQHLSGVGHPRYSRVAGSLLRQ
jgi:choline dehydrogenase-like flavoprotein